MGARSCLAPSRSPTARWSKRSRGRGDRRKRLDAGVCTSVSDIGDAENISKSYVSRILRLVLLAPNIIEAIVARRADRSLMLGQLERPLPASWEEQRRMFFDSALTSFC
jgi:hypothetical protein